jgi:hypothetical protein
MFSNHLIDSFNTILVVVLIIDMDFYSSFFITKNNETLVPESWSKCSMYMDVEKRQMIDLSHSFYTSHFFRSCSAQNRYSETERKQKKDSFVLDSNFFHQWIGVYSRSESWISTAWSFLLTSSPYYDSFDLGRNTWTSFDIICITNLLCILVFLPVHSFGIDPGMVIHTRQW